ncbi:hypothetical protein GFY24_24610 [Nocardia sp. SYP-A9097]|uniref:hypothetical protein n=1 Tax=Nocardia sp. SYP-A9097 TaxID=2663237 RepID=UPI00129AB6BC|nr:hypothetical protein [Nocardia sp. SYP-A9097]MRH90583.1 hypothetical protein [Nocardia sp. SYP-A9097]
MSTSLPTPTLAPAQQHQHATVMDPDAHPVLFENEHVRVIHSRASQSWQSPMHSHLPMVVISLGSGRQKVTFGDGTEQIVDLNPGLVVWQADSFDHSWELLSGEVDVVLVEVKSAHPGA